MSAQLTPEVKLSLPRPSAAIVSPSGTFYAQSSSTFDFDSQQTAKSIHVGCVPDSLTDATADSTLAASPPSVLLQDVTFTEIAWADDETLLFLRHASKEAQLDFRSSDAIEGSEQLSTLDHAQPDIDVWCINVRSRAEQLVGTLPTSAASDLKFLGPTDRSIVQNQGKLNFRRLPKGVQVPVQDVHIRVTRLIKRVQDGVVCDQLPFRHWDHLVGDGVKQVQVVKLAKTQQGQWVFDGTLLSPMANSTLECLVGPFGGSADFDLSPSHLVFTAKDPDLSPAWHTRQHIYIAPLASPSSEPRGLTNGGGARSCPTFSSDGSKIAWLEMCLDGYEADRNRVMLHELASGKTQGISEHWDRSPSSITWGANDQELFLLAEEHGCVKCFRHALRRDGDFVALTHEGSVSAVAPLPQSRDRQHAGSRESRVLFSISNFMSPTAIYLLDIAATTTGQSQTRLVSSLAQPRLEELNSPLRPAQSFWFDGAQSKVHGWIMFPPSCTSTVEEQRNEKWPLALIIHGGPQSATNDAWSTRWNLAVFAANGYVTVAINPTGSTGYGAAFSDAIRGEWAGLPYQDLVKGYKYVLDTFSAIDPHRTAALGPSNGGHMVNWIQGHNEDFGHGFKALVCHNGIFDTSIFGYETDEPYTFEWDNFGRPQYQDPELHNKWNPKNHVDKFNTPQLIIHSGRDYRVPDTQGIAMFTALQRKGVPSRLLYFPSENHWVLNPLNSRKWHDEVFKWLSEWV